MYFVDFKNNSSSGSHYCLSETFSGLKHLDVIFKFDVNGFYYKLSKHSIFHTRCSETSSRHVTHSLKRGNQPTGSTK
jgi:hypothetical protein